jgi:ABC-type sugar transport system ATPase subunit/ribose/xylose/arabinose/galactoside ABC-type transport system permease subunit
MDRSESCFPAQAILAVRGLSKLFPGTLALADVAADFQAGTIHALVGENGAGKSTLIQILAGVTSPDSGRILVEGRDVTIASPLDALRLGIHTVHQHSHLFPYLSLGENLALAEGYPTRALGRIDWPAIRREAQTALRRFGSPQSADTATSGLTAAQKQMAELAFALARQPKLLVLDEPTAVLPGSEAERLFAEMRRVAARGGCVVLVTHRLDEVFRIADRVTVLRDGRLVWEKPIEETDHDDLIRAMVGRKVHFARSLEPLRDTGTRLRVDGLTDEWCRFKSVDFRIGRGEIFGIYGLVGAGQSELCHAMCGLRPCRQGSIRLADAELQGLTAAKRLAAGLAYVPADRRAQGIFFQLSVGENISLATLADLSKCGFLSSRSERLRVQRSIDRLKIRTLGFDQAIGALSGGNQQKALLGRWLESLPGLLILEEPTQGVDVGAKEEFFRLVRQLAADGVSVLLVSSDLPELFALCHRIAVLRQGELTGPWNPDQATQEDILRASLPETADQHAAAAVTSKASARSLDRFVKALLPNADRLPRAARIMSLPLCVLTLLALLSMTVTGFATTRNLSDILVNISVLSVGALGMSVVLIAGAIDVSIGATLGLAAVAAAVADKAEWPAAGIGAAALVTGTALGTVNGLLSVWGRVHTIVITLGTMSIYRGLLIEWTGGRWIVNLSERITWLGRGNVWGVPALPIVALASAVLLDRMLKDTVAGRRIFAFGCDRADAALVGIHARHAVPLAFSVSGFLTGLAGLLHAGRYGQVQTNVGMGFELKAIAAAVIGGTHIMGGRGTVWGTLWGALLIGIIANLLQLARISAFWEGIVMGVLILLATVPERIVARWQESSDG